MLGLGLFLVALGLSVAEEFESRMCVVGTRRCVGEGYALGSRTDSTWFQFNSTGFIENDNVMASCCVNSEDDTQSQICLGAGSFNETTFEEDIPLLNFTISGSNHVVSIYDWLSDSCLGFDTDGVTLIWQDDCDTDLELSVTGFEREPGEVVVVNRRSREKNNPVFLYGTPVVFLALVATRFGSLPNSVADRLAFLKNKVLRQDMSKKELEQLRLQNLVPATSA